MPWCPSPGASCPRSRSGRLQAKEGPASEASRPVEGHRDAARPWLWVRSLQQLDIAHSVSNRPLEHLSDETLRLLGENARYLKEGSDVVVDGDGQVVND